MHSRLQRTRILRALGESLVPDGEVAGFLRRCMLGSGWGHRFGKPKVFKVPIFLGLDREKQTATLRVSIASSPTRPTVLRRGIRESLPGRRFL